MTEIRSVVFGRSEKCDVVIDDEYASPRHAQVFNDRSGQVWVRDLGSTNATWIQRGDGGGLEKVAMGQVAPLNPGDTLRIGRTSIPWTPPDA